jgi:hypothetical protein
MDFFIYSGLLIRRNGLATTSEQKTLADSYRLVVISNQSENGTIFFLGLGVETKRLMWSSV